MHATFLRELLRQLGGPITLLLDNSTTDQGNGSGSSCINTRVSPFDHLPSSQAVRRQPSPLRTVVKVFNHTLKLKPRVRPL